MILDSVKLFLAMGPAPTAPGTQPNPTAQMMQTFGMLIIMGFIFYFLLIRPQQKKAKEHEAMMKTIRTGDKVTTSSGIIGVVVSIKDKTVSIRSADTKLEVLKSAVAEITEKAGEPSTS